MYVQINIWTQLMQYLCEDNNCKFGQKLSLFFCVTKIYNSSLWLLPMAILVVLIKNYQIHCCCKDCFSAYNKYTRIWRVKDVYAKFYGVQDCIRSPDTMHYTQPIFWKQLLKGNPYITCPLLIQHKWGGKQVLPVE